MMESWFVIVSIEGDLDNSQKEELEKGCQKVLRFGFNFENILNSFYRILVCNVEFIQLDDQFIEGINY